MPEDFEEPRSEEEWKQRREAWRARRRNRLPPINLSKPLAEQVGLVKNKSEDGAEEGEKQELSFGKLGEQHPSARPHIDRRHNPLAAPLLVGALAALIGGVGGLILLVTARDAAQEAGERRNQQLENTIEQKRLRPTMSAPASSKSTSGESRKSDQSK
jgi:hypothetical protein